MKLLKIKYIQKNENESYLKKNYELIRYKIPRSPRSNKGLIRLRTEKKWR